MRDLKTEIATQEGSIVGSKTCSYEGTQYTDGAEICPENVCSTCKNGQWELKVWDSEQYPGTD